MHVAYFANSMAEPTLKVCYKHQSQKKRCKYVITLIFFYSLKLRYATFIKNNDMSNYTINVWLQTINTKFVLLNQFINQLLIINAYY